VARSKPLKINPEKVICEDKDNGNPRKLESLEQGISAEESCRPGTQPEQERGYVDCKWQRHLTRAVQDLWDLHPASMFPRCQTWRYRI
jgi:hypothetical protein